MGGEASAAHTHDTGVLDDLHDLLGLQLLQELVGLDGLVNLALAVGLDDHAQALAAAGVGTLLDGDNGTADAGMDGSGDEACGLTDHLADLDSIANSHNGVSGCAQVHGQGDHHGLGLGEADQSDVLGGLLAFDGVDAAVIAIETALTDVLDVLIDDLEVDLGVVAQLDGLTKYISIFRST